MHELEPYLYDHIPLTRHIGIRVDQASLDSVCLTAPLDANINHQQTGFGGSISALAILSCWSLLWFRLRNRTHGHEIVIHSNSIDYIAPVTADFSATCNAPPQAEWERFERSFDQRGRGRIELTATVDVGVKRCANFVGRYVAMHAT